MQTKQKSIAIPTNILVPFANILRCVLCLHFKHNVSHSIINHFGKKFNNSWNYQKIFWFSSLEFRLKSGVWVSICCHLDNKKPLNKWKHCRSKNENRKKLSVQKRHKKRSFKRKNCRFWRNKCYFKWKMCHLYGIECRFACQIRRMQPIFSEQSKSGKLQKWAIETPIYRRRRTQHCTEPHRT